jgi:hypothetical protein
MHERNLQAEINTAEEVQTLAEETEDKSIHAPIQWDSKPKPPVLKWPMIVGNGAVP